MPKATKTIEVPAASVAAKTQGQKLAEAAAARNSAAQKDQFTYLRDLEKGAPQAKGIVAILKEAGKSGLSRAELVAKMNGRITTRQPQSRILGYYQNMLVDCGAISIKHADGSLKVPKPAGPVSANIRGSTESAEEEE